MFWCGAGVCEVLAGGGPFAVPVGKKGVFVWANDLNADSFGSLGEAVERNKVCALLFQKALEIIMEYSWL